MAAIEKFLLGTTTNLLSFAVANGSNAVGSAYDNTDGATGNGYILCDVEFRSAASGTPWSGSSLVLWFLLAQDGITFEDGDVSVTPLRTPDTVFPVRPVSTLQVINRRVFLPWGVFKPLLRNEGTNTFFTGTLTIRPVTRQSA
jgi:hypothetical protein